jgi:BolA family transcriptional regulator, general stress-responsive regulator
MTDFLNELETKIVKVLNPEKIKLLDNSHLHKKHKSFDINKKHLKLIIHSEKLRTIKKIEAHKIIFSILEDEMKNKIHALEIEIK